MLRHEEVCAEELKGHTLQWHCVWLCTAWKRRKAVHGVHSVTQGYSEHGHSLDMTAQIEFQE